MKVCEENQLLINQYIDGELTPGEEEALRRHMESCAACRAYYEELCAISSSMTSVEFPKDLHENIMSAVDRCEKRGRLIRFPTLRRASAVAAAVAVALVGAAGLRLGVVRMDFQKAHAEVASNDSCCDSLETEPEGVAVASLEGNDKSAFTAGGGISQLEGGMAPQSRRKVYTIESYMLGWFSDSGGGFTLHDSQEALNGDIEEMASDIRLSQEDRDTWLVQLAEELGEEGSGHAFCIVVRGDPDDLPQIFAQRAQGAQSGSTLLVSVKNDDAVREEIAGSMAENGFEVFDDKDGEYFRIDSSGAEGLLIIVLQ